MSLSMKFRKLAGEKTFQYLRRWGYRLMHSLTPAFTEKNFRKYLIHTLGIRKGDTLFVHSSVFKLHIGFPPHKVITILQDIVGKNGTLLFPCWHFTERAEQYLSNPANVFSVKKSPSVMGLLPELARRYPTAHRSLHPTSSVVAIGKNAHELIKDHHLSEYPCDSFSPFFRIMNHNGKILGLGEKPEHSLSFIHVPEDELKEQFPVKTRTDKVFQGKVLDKEGNQLIVSTRAAHINIQNRDIAGFFKKYITSEECRLLRKNATWFYVADAVKLYEKLVHLAVVERKTIYGG
jgi:aminoglycoside N3'-acetyltransferase